MMLLPLLPLRSRKKILFQKNIFTKNKHALNEVKNPAGTKINVYDYLRENVSVNTKKGRSEIGTTARAEFGRAIKVI
jgi:hypothetical protein